MATKDFLGKDTRLPIDGKFQHVESLNTLIQDIQILIATRPGERVNRPTYGCNLYNRLWDNLEQVVVRGANDIRDALNEFEPRITLNNVRAVADRANGKVDFIVSFTVIETNTPANLVFPFTNPTVQA